MSDRWPVIIFGYSSFQTSKHLTNINDMLFYAGGVFHITKFLRKLQLSVQYYHGTQGNIQKLSEISAWVGYRALSDVWSYRYSRPSHLRSNSIYLLFWELLCNLINVLCKFFDFFINVKVFVCIYLFIQHCSPFTFHSRFAAIPYPWRSFPPGWTL